MVVVPDRLSPEAESLIENELSGTARVFVIAETMPIQEVEMRLSLLANPRLTRSDSGIQSLEIFGLCLPTVMPAYSRP